MRDIFDRHTDPMEEFQRKRRCSNFLRTVGIAVAAAILLVLTALLFASLLISCEKKELCYLPHPHDSRICHTNLTLNYSTLWDGELIGSYTRAQGEGGYPMRYILEFWEVDEEGNLGALIERKEIKGNPPVKGDNRVAISVDVPAFRMAVLCWAEPLPGGAKTNSCFDATDLRKLKLLAPYGHVVGKDAFTGSAIWDYTVHQFERGGVTLNESLTLSRPFGRYTLISNDIQEYLQKEGADAPLPGTVKVDYQLWIPTVYDVFHQMTTSPQADLNYTFSSLVLDKEKGELLIADDYIFIGTKDTDDSYYNLVATSYAEDGTMIKKTGNVSFRVHSNKHTLIYGAFLTDRKTNTPGIDDSFEDSEDIIIGDDGNVIVPD